MRNEKCKRAKTKYKMNVKLQLNIKYQRDLCKSPFQDGSKEFFSDARKGSVNDMGDKRRISVGAP